MGSSSQGGSALQGAGQGAAAGASVGGVPGAVIGAVIGAGVSLLGANKASKEAARKQAEQRRLQQEQLDLMRKLYEQEQGYIRPVRDRLTAEAMSEQPLDYARIAAQVKQNYANAARKFAGTKGGLSSAAQRGVAMDQASSLADAYGQGLTARRNLQMGLLSRDQSAQLGSQAAQGIGGLAAGYGRQADILRGAAQQGWSNFATGLGNVAYGLASMKRSQGMQDTTVPGNMSGLAYRPEMVEPPSYGTPPEVGGSPTLFQNYSPAYMQQPFMGQMPAYGSPASGYSNYVFGRK